MFFLTTHKMNSIHNKNISFLNEYVNESKFDWINYSFSREISYFSSGGGTHLYLIKNWNKKFLARINFYPGKNDWKVKRTEYNILKEIEPLEISPKVFVLNENNKLKQDFTIVEYIEGERISKFLKSDIIALAKDLKKLHSFAKQFDKNEELPYECDIYNEFADGEDKKIEKYDFKNIDQVFSKYNSIKESLGLWFNNLKIFEKCENLCLCHADLKSENILKTKSGIVLIDWECAGLDIPETDIGRLFAGGNFTKDQQNIFLKEYYKNIPSDDIMNRILSIKIVLDFFRIIENYCIHKRKQFNAVDMLNEINKYQKKLEVIKKNCP